MAAAIFPWRRVVVAGAGLSGRAAAIWCRRQGAHVLLCDRTPVEQWPRETVERCRKHQVEMVGGRQDGELLEGADLLVPSPGIPPENPLLAAARQRGVDVVGELALGVAFWKGPVIGITGTNGKTTTTLLISHLLEAAGVPHVTGGNCTPPLLELMDSNAPETVAVVEVSSFQLDTFPGTDLWRGRGLAAPRFHCGLLLNLSYDHLDRYPTLTAYARSKERLMELVKDEGWIVLPHRDRGRDFWDPPQGKRLLEFENLLAPKRNGEDGGDWGSAPGARFRGKVLEVRMDPGSPPEEFVLEQWPLPGPHNLSNLAAAVLAARVTGASRQGITGGMADFQGLPHRIEPVGRCRGVQFVNDSKATNVAATLAALETLAPPLVVILGGRGKGEVYDRLTHAAARGLMAGAVVMGEEAQALQRAVAGHVPCRRVEAKEGLTALREAVELGCGLLHGGGTLLLSPACASFDMFENYRQRGDAFRRVVEEWCE